MFDEFDEIPELTEMTTKLEDLSDLPAYDAITQAQHMAKFDNEDWSFSTFTL